MKLFWLIRILTVSGLSTLNDVSKVKNPYVPNRGPRRILRFPKLGFSLQ